MLAPLTFERLIAPVTIGEFYRDYWEKKPLHIRRDDRSYYGDLATARDVDALVAGFARGPGLSLSVIDRVGGQVRVREFDDGFDRDGVYRAYEAGATLRVKDARRYFAGAQLLTSEITKRTGARALINLYLTPPDSNGFDVHMDEHEVFVVQTDGRKHWYVYEDPVELPNDQLVRGRPGLFASGYGGARDPRLLEEHEVPPPLLHVALEPGDFLYVPRGFYHKAYTTDALSVHFTIGAYTLTWHDAVLAALADVFHQSPALRRSLPPDFASGSPDPEALARLAREAVAAVAERLDPEAVASAVDRIGERVVATTASPHHGLFDDVGVAAGVGPGQPVRLREGVVPRVREAEDKLVLAFNGRTVGLPLAARPILDGVLTGAPFTASELPTDIPEAGKLQLVRQLVRLGFLTPTGAPAVRGDGAPTTGGVALSPS